MPLHYIVTVNNHPSDIRGTLDLAVRQGRVQKSRDPAAVVQVHVGAATSHTSRAANGALQVAVAARNLSADSLLATIGDSLRADAIRTGDSWLHQGRWVSLIEAIPRSREVVTLIVADHRTGDHESIALYADDQRDIVRYDMMGESL